MALKNEKLVYSILPCTDPRKGRIDFPCGWMDPGGNCRWIGEKKCKPTMLDWIYTDKIDDLKDVKI